MIDIRSASVFAEKELVISSSSMNESVLNEMNRIERYTSQSWESLQANYLYKDFIKFRTIFPESLPCEMPHYKGLQNDIELKPGSDYCA